MPYIPPYSWPNIDTIGGGGLLWNRFDTLFMSGDSVSTWRGTLTTPAIYDTTTISIFDYPRPLGPRIDSLYKEKKRIPYQEDIEEEQQSKIIKL